MRQDHKDGHQCQIQGRRKKTENNEARDAWTYLEIPFTYAGKEKVKGSEVLVKTLENLSKGPLKPR